MDRLSLILSLFTGSVLTGTLTILFFTLGWYAWTAVAIAAITGFVLAWPVARLISRRIKHEDPNYPMPKKAPLIPDPAGREI